MIRVETNGRLERAYIGTTSVPLDPITREPEPLSAALAQLREDCKADRKRIMDEFRSWLWKGGLW